MQATKLICTLLCTSYAQAYLLCPVEPAPLHPGELRKRSTKDSMFVFEPPPLSLGLLVSCCLRSENGHCSGNSTDQDIKIGGIGRCSLTIVHQTQRLEVESPLCFLDVIDR